MWINGALRAADRMPPMPSIPPAQLGGLKAPIAVALGCAALIAVSWAITMERISYERADAVEDAVRQNSNLAIAFEEQTLHAIKRADLTLLRLKREYERDGRIANLREIAVEGD